MGWPVVGNFNASVQGPLINPPVVEAGGAGAPVAPHQPPEQVQQNGMQAQQPAQQLAQHAAFVDKLFAEATRLAYAGRQKDIFNEIESWANVDPKQEDKVVSDQKEIPVQKQIKDAFAAVKKSLVALDKLTGRQIVEYARPGNENIKKMLEDALKAHMDLADLLMKVPDATGKMGLFSNQAIFLNKRVCAIANLIGELDGVCKKAQEGGDAEALGRTHQTARLGEITARNSAAGRELRQTLNAITEKVKTLPVLEKIASNQAASISEAEIDETRRRLDELSQQLDEAQKDAEDPATQDLIKSARKVLNRANDRLEKTNLAQVAKAVTGEVVELITLPGKLEINWLKTNLIAINNEISKNISDLREQHKECAELTSELLQLASEAASSPADANALGAKLALDKKLNDLLEKITRFEETLDDCRNNQKNAPDGAGDMLESLGVAFSHGAVRGRIQEAITQLKQLVGQTAKLDGHVLKRVLDDPEAFSAVVEARVRGLDPELIDFDLSTGKLMGKPEKIGHGTFSSAFKCTFAREDGTKDVRVFKPDGDATRGLQSGIISTFGGMDKTQKAINLNFMAHEVAEMIGAGHTVCRSSAGFIDGQFGFLMEVAPGLDSEKMKNFLTSKKSEAIGEMTAAEYLKLTPEEKTLILAQMAQQLNQLQWADLITGQLDRHSTNYNVAISREGKVTIKGFDNDQCGAVNMVGIGKVKIEDKDMEKFKGKLLKREKEGHIFTKDGLLYAKISKRIKQLARKVKGFDAEKGGVIDISKIESAKLLATLIDGTGLRSIAIPTYMDQGVYDRIVDLTEGAKQENGRYEGGKLELFRKTLLKRGLTAEQAEAAVKRLIEARDIGNMLKKARNVYSLHELENENTLKAIWNNKRQQKLDESAGPCDGPTALALKKTVRAFGTNYFNRLQFVALMPEEWKNGGVS